MLSGKRVILRRITDDDWKLIEAWSQDRDALFGPHQRFQMDMLPELKAAYAETGLLARDSACLIIETVEGKRPIGIVRYRPLPLPEHDLPVPEVGFAVADPAARGKGYAKEALGLLLGYLFENCPTERIMAVTGSENVPSQRVLEALGFRREGVLRRAMFRGEHWSDAYIYGLLRDELTDVSQANGDIG
jgi:RimJ/RimL family protein N-acetyltransferase